MKIQKWWILLATIVAFSALLAFGSAAQARFINNGDGTVTDTATCRMWQQGQTTHKTNSEADTYCRNLVLAGFNDWRLPWIGELQSLIYTGNGGPPYINTAFFSYDSYWNAFWSGSLYNEAWDGPQYYTLHFVNGNTFVETGFNWNAARAVRSIQCGTLTVSKIGSGGGTVTSTDGYVNCGGDCDERYPNGTSVTLTAVADPNTIFIGWSGGGCSGTDNCTVTVGGNVSITAEFCADNDGDGFCAEIDCDDAQVLYQDNDGDGFGSTTKVACGGVTNSSDCNDNQLQYLV